MDTYRENKPRLIDRIRPNFLWIIFVVLSWYILIAGFGHLVWEALMNAIVDVVSPAMFFTLDLYAATIVDVATLFLLCNIFKKNRYIWKSFAPADFARELREGDTVSEDDAYAELYGRSRNTFRMLGMGLLLGFLTNFFCIILALLHGDIKLYFDCALSQIPYFVFSLLCVCLQSTSEELWCRGFLYERLHERYPLWVAIAINGVLFGLLHIFNPGASAIPIIGIVITGLSYSLLRWYSGNIWIAMGIHTGWNFTQNYLFGLPNSGLVSEASVFHLDAANAMSSLIYDWDFGIEGGLPALFIDGLLGAIIIYLAVKNGRIKELGMNRLQSLEAMGLRMHVDEELVEEVPAEEVSAEEAPVVEAHAEEMPEEVPAEEVSAAEGPVNAASETEAPEAADEITE